MSRPGVTLDDLATTNRSIPVNVPHPPAKPLVAPTGSPGVNSVIDVINATAAPFQNAPPAEHGAAGVIAQGVGGVLGLMGAPQMIIDTAFASLTAPIAKLFPALPAITIGGMHIGTPHMHAHPPSLVAPGVMIPLPSIGPLLGSGAVTVLIGGMPAARAGDIGVAVTCGSIAPPFSVHTGSSNVFIGGARAARIGDITEHCNPEGGAEMSAFSIAISAAAIAAGAAGAMTSGSPWAGAQAAADAAMLALRLLCGKDPGIPPCFGSLIGPPVPNVLIGGFPCPPVGEMAVGALLKGLKKAAGALKKKFGSRRSNGHCGSASEPVYVVTGENFNSFVDFVSGGLFEWRRHYTTARHRADGPLGHGWRHFYQRSLRLRLHRAVFTDWDGVTIEFPRFEPGSNKTRAEGYVLERLGRGHFRITFLEQPAMEFAGNEFGGELRLASMRSRERELAFEYDERGLLSAAVERTANAWRRFEWRYDVDGHMTQLDEVRNVDIARWNRHSNHAQNGHAHNGGAENGHLRGGARQQVSADAPDMIARARYHFDTAGNLSRASDALEGAWSYEYDAFHRWTKQSDPRRYSYMWRYDAVGRCIEARGEDGLWAATLEYRPEQGLTLLTQGDNATWQYHYDGDGFITKIVDPYGGVKVRERDSEGKIALEVDSGGRTMRWLYDDNDAHYARVDRFGHVFPPELEMPVPPNPFERKLPDTAHGRLFQGAPVAAQDTLGADENFIYGLPDELQHQARLCFRLRSKSNEARMHQAHVERDALGRKTRERDTSGRTREWQYDATGNLLSKRDRDGRIVTQKTTSWNLIAERRTPLGEGMQYAYSRLEQIVGVKDPLGNETRYDYDLKERLARVHRGGRLRWEYVYDKGDHLLEKRDGHGRVVFRNEIHPNHFVKARQLASGGLHKFDYDERGRIIEASTDQHEVHVEYDASGRRVRDVRDGIGIEREHVGTSHRTTTLGRFMSMTKREGGTTRLLNAAGKETRLTFRDGGIVRRECANGTVEVLQYDGDRRLHGRLGYRRDAYRRLSSWSKAYRYTPEGDLIQRDDSLRGTTRYEVDEAHRLVAELLPTGERREFWHDPADNLRLGRVQIGSSNKLQASVGESFEYDDHDCLAERRQSDGSLVRYRYDSFDLLVRVERLGVDGLPSAPPWEATYDAVGRRIETSWGQNRRAFYWDGDRLAAEALPSGRIRIYDYATLDALVPISFVEFVSMDADSTTGETFHVFSEPSGMPEHIENELGKTVWSAERAHPFGSLEIGREASVEYNLRWPGHYHDPETGLHYNRYRSYDPSFARYLQADPSGHGGSPVNLYAYCSNPLVRVDVLGLHPEHVEGAAGAHENAGEPDGKEGTPGHSEGPALPGVSAEERALAATSENSRAARAARKKVVSSFLAEHGQEWDPKTKSMQSPTKKQIRSQLRGHDLDQPVKVGPPPECPSPQGQWQRKGGNQGSYYADQGTKPTEIGISSYSRGSDGRYESKEQKPYNVNPDAPYLESTSAPVNDTWSVKGQDVPAKGGGTQRVIPDRSMAKPAGSSSTE
jgi:RHS repeat-associated protein